MAQHPKTITYQGLEYLLVDAAATDLEELRTKATELRDLAQMLRTSTKGSEISGLLDTLNRGLTNLVKANNLLLDYNVLLPPSFAGNSERVLALSTDAADHINVLQQQLQNLSSRLGRWALRIDQFIRDEESAKAQETNVSPKAPAKSRQFSHLW
jgi:hypothetical protein